MGIAVAIKVAELAVSLPAGCDPNHPITQEDRVYFCFGALALGWVSVESIIRRFKF
jgi:hypothetical protein